MLLLACGSQWECFSGLRTWEHGMRMTSSWKSRRFVFGPCGANRKKKSNRKKEAFRSVAILLYHPLSDYLQKGCPLCYSPTPHPRNMAWIFLLICMTLQWIMLRRLRYVNCCLLRSVCLWGSDVSPCGKVGWQTDRQTDRQADRQADSMTDTRGTQKIKGACRGWGWGGLKRSKRGTDRMRGDGGTGSVFILVQLGLFVKFIILWRRKAVL